MIIQKTKDNFKIKLLDKQINIYDPQELEKLTQKILKKIQKIKKTRNLIILDIYQDNMYGTIINLKEYPKLINIANEIEVKINIHTNNPLLYKINYFDIEKSIKENLYYYKNNFYLEPKKNVTKKDYLNLIEHSEIIYETSLDIINYGVKIKL